MKVLAKPLRFEEGAPHVPKGTPCHVPTDAELALYLLELPEGDLDHEAVFELLVVDGTVRALVAGEEVEDVP